MIQGTGSDVGKSLLVTGLCRAYRRRGLAVRPFKPQNMSNNAAVTADGGEIGRAQALQAQAAGVAPSVHMNPVLLKPTSETGAQVIVQGRIDCQATARDYHALKPRLLPRVLDSFAAVAEGADLVLVEGAGSAAEVNLRQGDIANMGFAEAAGVPVVLLGDIDRGGVIAAIVGTHALLEDSERTLVKGYVINKFRGDKALFDGAIELIAGRCALECFGVVPFFPRATLLPKEDSMALDGEAARPAANGAIKVAVPRLPRIANFDDIDPLAAEDDVAVTVVEPGRPLPGDADLVLLPGSKATLGDLADLRRQGWDVDIAAHVRRGGLLVGLCGGYQMLGRTVADPGGVEGPAAEAEGLGHLDVETVIGSTKTLSRVKGADALSGEAIEGYEMRMGATSGPDTARPWLTLEDGRGEGARSASGLVMGSYVHGLFAADGFRHAFLERISSGRARGESYEAQVEDTLDALASHLEANMDLDRLLAAAGAVGG
ncbi:MAG: cobyric acid synthase [Proteobacteria bacterium]|nr:cobyric acid synthase [Pseudomonadota bacterium]